MDFEIARLKYARWHYDGPVLMLRSAKRLSQDSLERRGKFSRHLTGDVQLFDIGATHADIRSVDNQRFARGLRQAIALAQDALVAMR